MDRRKTNPKFASVILAPLCTQNAFTSSYFPIYSPNTFFFIPLLTAIIRPPSFVVYTRSHCCRHAWWMSTSEYDGIRFVYSNARITRFVDVIELRLSAVRTRNRWDNEGINEPHHVISDRRVCPLFRKSPYSLAHNLHSILIALYFPFEIFTGISNRFGIHNVLSRALLQKKKRKIRKKSGLRKKCCYKQEVGLTSNAGDSLI